MTNHSCVNTWISLPKQDIKKKKKRKVTFIASVWLSSNVLRQYHEFQGALWHQIDLKRWVAVLKAIELRHY